MLVFSQYTLTLDVLEEYVTDRWGSRGAVYFRLDGTTNRIAREMDMRSFNAAGSAAFLYLISTRAGGQGINLATADVVVLYDTCYNPQVRVQGRVRGLGVVVLHAPRVTPGPTSAGPGLPLTHHSNASPPPPYLQVDLQAQDRAHRIGQTKQVKVYRLIAESSFEERILMRARQKLILDALVIKKDGEASVLADGADGEEGEVAKLSVAELWSILSHGAEKVPHHHPDLSPNPHPRPHPHPSPRPNPRPNPHPRPLTPALTPTLNRKGL